MSDPKVAEGPRTAAGKALLDESWSDRWMTRPVGECEALVAAIEAEAATAALAALRAKVEKLHYLRAEAHYRIEVLHAIDKASSDHHTGTATLVERVEGLSAEEQLRCCDRVEGLERVNGRLRKALRVARHKPHDQSGEPVEGFPVCSVCGAIQTDRASDHHTGTGAEEPDREYGTRWDPR